MKSAFDKLNLRPGERRLMVIVAIVIFIVLNFVFVFPNFGEYGKAMQRTKDTASSLRRFKAEVAHAPSYEAKLRELQSAGNFVAEEDQALQLQREVDSQATLTGVTILQRTPAPRTVGAKTNAFFDESALVVNFSSGEKELVEFLYNLGKGNSLVRVRSMNLQPELPNRYKLSGSLTLVESFQRKQVRAQPAAATTSKAASSSKPPSKPKETKAPAPATKSNTAPPKAAPANPKTNQPGKAPNPGKKL